MDFIMPWVNGNDPEWRAAFFKYKKQDNQSTHDARFRDWDNLQYWFRGVEQFAPWVNKIHLITWGHLPEWLNISHPKLNIVKHQDFIPEKYLPTFNSRTIELNFHRIKELAEEYVLFNDDIFILKPLKETDFFKSGLPCDMALMNVIHSGEHGLSLFRDIAVINLNLSKDKAIRKAPFNWFNLKYGLKDSLNNLFLYLGARNKFTGFYNPHITQPARKSTLKKIWEKEYNVMDESCSSKFRKIATVNHYLVRYWELASNCFHPLDIRKLGEELSLLNSDVSKIVKFIEGQKRKIICINDHAFAIIDFEPTKIKINAALEEVLPLKSSFEL